MEVTEQRLKRSSDQSIERFVSLFNVLSIREELTIESVTENFKENNINFEAPKETNCIVSCLMAIYGCIVVSFCCVFNYEKSKEIDGYEYDEERIAHAFDVLGYEKVDTFDQMKKLSK